MLYVFVYIIMYSSHLYHLHFRATLRRIIVPNEYNKLANSTNKIN